ncbi:iduronate 2-sulfatase isoform X2 [Arctopsyche grandis]
MPQFFKDNGYDTFSFGKVFHPGKSSNFTDDYPYSWSEPPYHPSTEVYKQAKVCQDEETGKLSRNLVCPVDVEDQPERTLPDIQTMQATVEKLTELRHNGDRRPYFIAVGFHKPHIPLKFPKEYLEYYPMKNISLPSMPFRPPTLPTVAWNPWLDIRDREDIKRLNIPTPFGQMPDIWSLKIKQSYYAAISYVDDLIGKILRHVNMNNTIIVLTSDHGWSLGEHGEWSKYSNYDVSVKVPLLICAPNFRHKVSKDVVELVDLFPTLAELSGMSIPKCDRNGFMKLCSEGRSLVPIMKNEKDSDGARFAFSQYPRPGAFPTVVPNSDKPKLKQIKIMGYSVRSDRFRYTEWVEFNHTAFKPNWSVVFGKELYDHSIDSGEDLNLVDRKELSDVQNYLRSKLKELTSH